MWDVILSRHVLCAAWSFFFLMQSINVYIVLLRCREQPLLSAGLVELLVQTWCSGSLSIWVFPSYSAHCHLYLLFWPHSCRYAFLRRDIDSLQHYTNTSSRHLHFHETVVHYEDYGCTAKKLDMQGLIIKDMSCKTFPAVGTAFLFTDRKHCKAE